MKIEKYKRLQTGGPIQRDNTSVAPRALGSYGGPLYSMPQDSLRPLTFPAESTYVAPAIQALMTPVDAPLTREELWRNSRPKVYGKDQLVPSTKVIGTNTSTHSKSKVSYAAGGILGSNPWAAGIGAALGLVGGIAGAVNYKPQVGAEKGFGDYLANTGGNPLNLIPELIKMNKDKNTIVSGSPGAYASGGQMDDQLSSNAFQVKGNPNVTDGNSYNINGSPVKLDHDEVIDTERNFVFSDDLKIGKKSFADMALKPNKAIGKAEKVLQRNPYDEQAKKTVEFSNRNLGTIAAKQEEMATLMGLRDNTQPQGYAAGGAVGPGDRHTPLNTSDLIRIPSDSREGAEGNMRFYDPNAKKIIYWDERLGQYFEPMPYSDMLGRGETKNADLVREYSQKYPAKSSMASIQGRIPESPYTTPRPPAYTESAQQPIQQPQNSKPLRSEDTFRLRRYLDPFNDYNVNRSTNPIEEHMPLPYDSNWPEFDILSDAGVRNYDSPSSLQEVDKRLGIEQPNSYYKPKGKVSSSKIQGKLSNEFPRNPSYVDPQMDLYVQGNTQKYSPVDPLQPLNMLQRNPDSFMGPAQEGSQGVPIPYTPQVSSERSITDPTAPNINTTGKLGPIDKTSETDTNSMTLGDYLQFAEVGSKFFQTLRGPERENQILDNTRITKNNYDVRPQLLQSQRSFQNQSNSIDSPSLNLRRSLTNNLYASKLNADAGVISQYDNMNKQANSQYEQQLSNQRRYNIQSTQYTNNLNAANRGAYDSTVQNAYTSLGNLGESLNQRKTGQDALAVLKQRYPEVYKGVVEELFNKKKN